MLVNQWRWAWAPGPWWAGYAHVGEGGEGAGAGWVFASKTWQSSHLDSNVRKRRIEMCKFPMVVGSRNFAPRPLRGSTAFPPLPLDRTAGQLKGF